MRRMTPGRRRTLGVAVPLVAALTLAACTGGSDDPPSDDSDLAGQTVRLMLLQSGYRPAVEPLVQQFTEETGIRVELIGYGGDTIQERTQLEINSGTATTDVFSIDGPPYMATMYQGLEPLQPFVERDSLDLSVFVPRMLEMGRYPSSFTVREAGYEEGTGDLYTLPVRIGPHILHYRADILEELGLEPPRTMDDFADAARQITEESDGETYGVALQGAQSIWIVMQWYDFLWSFGADLLNETFTESALDDPRAVEATQFMVDLYQDGYAPPSTPSVDLDAAVALLQQGSAAMYPEYSPRALVLDDPEASATAGKWAWTPMPSGSGEEQGVGVLTGWSLGINKHSQHKDAAWELIKYLTSPEAQRTMAVEYANAPTVTSVLEDPEYQELNPSAAVVLEAAQSARGRPGVPQILEIEYTVLAYELNAALIGEKTAEQAMSDAHERINALLSGDR